MLLIKPRWFSPEATAAQMETLRQEHPDAQITLMAESVPPEWTAEFLALPDLRRDTKKTLLATARRLRKVRYDEAIVMADAARQEVGYLEAKFWAFAARARIRKLGTIRPLRFSEEAYDKWRRIVLQRVFLFAVRAALGLHGRLASLRRASSHRDAPLAARRLEAFIILHQAERLSGKAPGRLLIVGDADAAFSAVAQQFGWNVTQIPCVDPVAQGVARRDGTVSNGDFGSFSPAEPFDFLYLVGEPTCLEPFRWARMKELLSPGGIGALHIRTAMLKEAKPPAGIDPMGPVDNFTRSIHVHAEQAGMEVLQAGESLFSEDAADIWLRIPSGEASRP